MAGARADWALKSFEVAKVSISGQSNAALDVLRLTEMLRLREGEATIGR